MVSPRIIETCGEHKLSVMDKKVAKLKRIQRAQWLRAAVLGANDGLLSTTSLMLGVGAAKEEQWSMVLSGIAGAIAGACSMSLGEFVSVSTQRDIESSVIDQCNSEDKLNGDNDGTQVKIQVTSSANPSLAETNGNVVMSPAPSPSRTLTPTPFISPFLSPSRSPMMKVVMTDARTSTVHEDEADDGKEALPNPYKAAAASAVSFLCGSFFPILAAMLVCDNRTRTIVVVIVASIELALFGGIGAFLGGSPIRASALRVLFGGWISMALTYGLLKPLDQDDKGGKDHSQHND